MKTVVWTDGSCNVNGIRGRGGWAALIEQAGTLREISGCAHGTTQHRMELTAVCEALEKLTGAIEVRTDTPYVAGCFNENPPWHERWLRDGAWKGSNGAVKNRDLWERLFGLVWNDGRNVNFERIKGHARDPNNDRVDALARAAALSCAPPDTFAVVEVVETPAPARRPRPRRASWRDLPAAEMAAHLLATPTISDRVWTDEPRLPRETRTAFIRRVLLGGRDRRDGNRVLTRPTWKAFTPADSALDAAAAIARANFGFGPLPFDEVYARARWAAPDRMERPAPHS